MEEQTEPGLKSQSVCRNIRVPCESGWMGNNKPFTSFIFFCCRQPAGDSIGLGWSHGRPEAVDPSSVDRCPSQFPACVVGRISHSPFVDTGEIRSLRQNVCSRLSRPVFPGIGRSSPRCPPGPIRLSARPFSTKPYVFRTVLREQLPIGHPERERQPGAHGAGVHPGV